MTNSYTAKYQKFLVLISAAVILVLTFFASEYFKKFNRDRQVNSLVSQNKNLSKLLSANPDEALKMLAEIAIPGSSEYLLISPDGKFLAATGEIRTASPLDYTFFSDVKAALKGEVSWMEGSDYGENSRSIFISFPVPESGVPGYIVRNKLDPEILNKGQTEAGLYIAVPGLSAVLLMVFLFNSHKRNTSIIFARLRDFISDLAESNFNKKIYFDLGREADLLADALNSLSRKSSEKISVLTSRQNELEAVFSGMREGVLLIDSDLKIIKINRAAFEMMGTVSQSCEGKSIEEVVRNVHLQKYIRRVLQSGVPEEIELSLHENREISIQVYSSMISDLQNRKIALMVVLNNITQLKQLENVRKDFVANVSHELKTPITSIQGFVETLLDGAMHNPEENKRFLEIIRRQTERLNFIFNDLLVLAGLEKEPNSRMYDLDSCDLVSLAESVKEVCQLKAGKKSLLIDSSGLQIRNIKANASLLEQALVNLVDNAVKYTAEGKEIRLISRQEGDMVRISVKDNGLGIEEGHLGRIFERFYRVDQARSREEGGTGLGLAIVKHIALLHGGKVDVRSEPGKGSEFSILIPNI